MPTMTEAAPPATAAPEGLDPRWRRVGLLVLGLVAATVAFRASGLHERLTLGGLREAVVAAGVWGRVLFVAAFCAGELLHVPGLLFVAAGVLLWGRVDGGLFAFGAALASLSVSFGVVRAAGGTALDGVKAGWVKRALARLEARPVLTVALLRAVLALAPPLNVALALAPLRFRDYLVGSAIGLVPPVLLAVLLVDRVAASFS